MSSSPPPPFAGLTRGPAGLDSYAGPLAHTMRVIAASAEERQRLAPAPTRARINPARGPLLLSLSPPRIPFPVRRGPFLFGRETTTSLLLAFSQTVPSDRTIEF